VTESNNGNIPATIDLLQALIPFGRRDPEIRKELKERFSNALERPNLISHYVWTIATLKGAFYYSIQQYDSAIDAWIKAMRVMPDGDIFHVMQT